MRSRVQRSLVAASALALAVTAARGVQGQTKANWLTDGDDPQRTSWQRHETLISPATART